MKIADSYRLRQLTLAAVCTALCVVLPIAFHSVPNGGSIFLPMHIPVLLCGLVCAWPYGLICGLMGPLLSSILTGMPGAAYLPAMMVECGTYGLVASLIFRALPGRNLCRELYIAQIGAMLAGRVVSGIAKALIFTPGLSLAAWATASFLTALPGIVLQLIFLPGVVMTLMKARVIPARCHGGANRK